MRYEQMRARYQQALYFFHMSLASSQEQRGPAVSRDTVGIFALLKGPFEFGKVAQSG